MNDPRKIAALALMLVATIGLAGCGANCCQNCGGGGSGLLGGLNRGGGLSPLAPTSMGGGSGQSWNTPVLGGGRGDAPPPSLTQQGPSAPVSFDSDTQSVLSRYNATIEGPWATPDYVQFVVKSMQLYPPLRQHPLRIIVGPDPNRPGLSGFWTTNGGRATIYLYDPQVLSTPAHEIAHDHTIMVQRNEGRRLMGLFGQVAQSAYARNYSKSDEREFAADALSYYARRLSGLSSGRENYNPPPDVVAAVTPMLSQSQQTR